MFSARRKNTAEMVRKAFEILLAHPEGLTSYTIFLRFQQGLTVQYEGDLDDRKIWDGLVYGMVAPAKAHWLNNDQGRWLVTEEGRHAFHQFQDPERFFVEAGRYSLKGWVTVRFPSLYAWACKARYQISIEYRMARRIGARQLMRELTGFND